MGHTSGHLCLIFIKGKDKGQKGDGNGTVTVVSNINTYSDNSALELTQYNYTQVLKIWVDSDLCQRNLEGI